jgi:ribosomal protein S27E
MKTEREFGYEYAESTDATEPVDINTMVTHTVDIPDGDYVEMKRAGIENPNARKYWAGYNEYVLPRMKRYATEDDDNSTTLTVKCSECGWITDLNTLSETNPTCCPECGGSLVDAYTGEEA